MLDSDRELIMHFASVRRTMEESCKLLEEAQLTGNLPEELDEAIEFNRAELLSIIPTTERLWMNAREQIKVERAQKG